MLVRMRLIVGVSIDYPGLASRLEQSVLSIHLFDCSLRRILVRLLVSVALVFVIESQLGLWFSRLVLYSFIYFFNSSFDLGLYFHDIQSHPICYIQIHEILAENLDVLEVIFVLLLDLNFQRPRLQERLEGLRQLVVICRIHLDIHFKLVIRWQERFAIVISLQEFRDRHGHEGVLVHSFLQKITSFHVDGELAETKLQKRHWHRLALAVEVVIIPITETQHD